MNSPSIHESLDLVYLQAKTLLFTHKNDNARLLFLTIYIINSPIQSSAAYPERRVPTLISPVSLISTTRNSIL